MIVSLLEVFLGEIKIGVQNAHLPRRPVKDGKSLNVTTTSFSKDAFIAEAGHSGSQVTTMIGLVYLLNADNVCVQG